MPTLNWIGKETVVGHHKEVPFKLLEKDENLSAGDSESGNFLIEGDNLEALKSLLPHYKGKIKCIYIDPPYNTGNENWIYNDNVNSPKMKEWLGNVVGKEDLNRHDKWLCLMYPRIVLLRELLSDDGVIFISIDDNEQAHLKLICDEIFGENNFVGQFVWHKKDNASFLSKEIVTLKEYILMYKKSNNFEGTFDKEIDLSRHRELINISNNVQSRILPKENVLIENGNFSGKVDAGKYGSEQFFIEVLEPFEVKDGFSFSDIKMKGRFSWSQKKIEEEIAEGGKIEIKTIKSFKPIFFREQNDRNIPFRPIVDLLSKKIDSRIETSHDANAEIKKLFFNVVFNYPKPSKLIELLVNAVVRFDFQAIILDSFAGSGTTGHSVLELNKSDGGNRKFILIELETEIAQNVTAKRLEKVIKGYEVEKGSGKVEKVEGLGSGFTYCKLGQTLFGSDGKICESITFEELARHIFFLETKTPLTEKPNSPLIGKTEDLAIYLLYNGILKDKKPKNGNVLTTQVLADLPKFEGQKIIYGTSCRLSKQRLENYKIKFRQIPYDVGIS